MLVERAPFLTGTLFPTQLPSERVCRRESLLGRVVECTRVAPPIEQRHLLRREAAIWPVLSVEHPRAGQVKPPPLDRGTVRANVKSHGWRVRREQVLNQSAHPLSALLRTHERLTRSAAEHRSMRNCFRTRDTYDRAILRLSAIAVRSRSPRRRSPETNRSSSPGLRRLLWMGRITIPSRCSFLATLANGRLSLAAITSNLTPSQRHKQACRSSFCVQSLRLIALPRPWPRAWLRGCWPTRARPRAIRRTPGRARGSSRATRSRRRCSASTRSRGPDAGRS